MTTMPAREAATLGSAADIVAEADAQERAEQEAAAAMASAQRNHADVEAFAEKKKPLPALPGQPLAKPTAGPRSAYYTGPPGKDSVFGTPPCGIIGRDMPRAIVRVERDYTGGELCQFHPTFPLELEGRIRPFVFSELINDLNSIIIEANDAGWACFDNTLAVLTLYASPVTIGTRYSRVRVALCWRARSLCLVFTASCRR